MNRPTALASRFMIQQDTNLPELLKEDEALFGDMLQVIVVLIVIIGMILLLLKFLSQKNRQWMGNRSIRMLGGVQLGPQKSLQMVEIGHTIYLIGVGDNVQLLTKIENEEEIATIMMLLDNEEKSGKALDWLNPKQWNVSHKLQEQEDQHSQEDQRTFEEIFYDKMKRVSNRGDRVQEILEEDKPKERWPEKD